MPRKEIAVLGSSVSTCSDVGERDNSNVVDSGPSTAAVEKMLQKMEGENRIIPGKRITVKAVGANFTGEWLVERVVHDCSNVAGGFKTRVWLRRNKTGKEACR